MNEAPFTPGPTVLITLSASSQRVQLGAGAGSSGTPQVLVSNGPPGTAAVGYIKFGDVTVTAALTDTPIFAGAAQIFTLPAGATHAAAIGTTSGVMYFTVGHGV